jgi:hypothetical protein
MLTMHFRSRLRANLTETGLTRPQWYSKGTSRVQVRLGRPLKETTRRAVAA